MDKLEELKQIIESKGGKLLSSEYINSHSKIEVIDELGNLFSIRPYSLKQGKWSPFTAQFRKAKALIKYTITDLQAFAKSKGGSVIDLEYINDKYKYTWIDSKGREFKMDWYHVNKRGYWSQHEKNDKLAALHTKYTIHHLNNFAEQFQGVCLSTVYTRGDNKYLWKDRFNRTFERSWIDVKDKSDLLAFMKSSHEQEINNFIISLGFETTTDKTILKGKEIDILIPSLKIGIEVNGIYWHTEKRGKDKLYHYNKFNDCVLAGYELIQIYDKEWQNRKDQIKSFLTAKLGKNQKIGARHTNCRVVDKQAAKEFLDKYHIQGSCVFKISYGLYYKEELVSLITIGNHHRGGSNNVLSRFVGKTGISIIGGLSKLVKHALNTYETIITWVDLRYSNGYNWLKSGWKLEEQLKPDYVYFNESNNQLISKQSRMKKKVNTPEGMTEKQHAELDGLTRVYDCGKLRLGISI